MEHQFKIIPSAMGLAARDSSQFMRNGSMHFNAERNSGGGTQQSSRLPGIHPVQPSGSTSYVRGAYIEEPQRFSSSIRPQAFQPAMMERCANAPLPGSMPNASAIHTFEPLQAGSFITVPGGTFGSAAPRQAESPRARAQGQSKKRNRRKRGNLILATMMGLCLCALLLAGSGYWFFHSHAAASSSSAQTIHTGVTDPTTIPTTAPTVAATTAPSPTAVPVLSPVPLPWQTDAQIIVVSIGEQRLTAYVNGQPKMTTLVTTGMPDLYTPEQVYHIIGRVADIPFISPWPKGSPYYYAPLHVNYGLQLTASGIYLHDATWRSEFGPGTNVPHNDPVYGQETGSHGCVELPLSTMKWLYNWAENGIVVDVVP